MKRRVYLDAAAAHPVRPASLRAFTRAAKAYGNPSAPHEEGRKAKDLLEDARMRIARATGAKPDAVIFTGGASESNALAIVGHIRARLAQGAKPEELQVLYSATQHASVIGAVAEVKRLGILVQEIPLREGGLDMDAFRALLSPQTALVTMDVVCGETGTRHDTRAVRKMLDELPGATRPVFHVDATQAPLIENMERTRLGADLITFDAQKIGGVRGIGALIAPPAVALRPLVGGGGQERGLRSGTPSPALAAAFAVALHHAQAEREDFVSRAAKMKEELRSEILKSIDGAVVNGGPETIPSILNLSLLGRDTDYLTALLDEAGFSVATRSSCETDAEGSRVVLAYTGDLRRASSTLRISFDASANASDLRRFAQALISAVAFLDSVK